MSALQTHDIVAFASSKDWRQRLATNHNRSQGVWLRFYKKDSGVLSVDYDDALCYGWIDGQLKPYDEKNVAAKIYTASFE
jgi:uncharacterized protein YdeI (YjbR/CyaY-like superfamily)